MTGDITAPTRASRPVPPAAAAVTQPDPAVELIGRTFAEWQMSLGDPSATPFADTLLAALREAGWHDPAEVERLRAELAELKGSRIVSVVFGHASSAPRPFALYRREDATGVSGTGIVALGAEWPDGTVVLRWMSDWPTSVVFHDRGMESVEAIHGHGGKTTVVWLSEELGSLAEMEQERDALRAELAGLRPLADAWHDGMVQAGVERDALLGRVEAMERVVDAATRWAEIEHTRNPQTEHSSIWLEGAKERRQAVLAAVDALPPREEPRTDG